MPGALKRTRTFSPAAKSLAMYRPAARAPYKKRRQTFVPGRDRVGGYYGRMQPYGGEIKFHDVNLNGSSISVAGAVTDSIIKIAQGTTESTRIGRKCTIKAVHWHLHVQLPSIATTTIGPADILRIILFVDKQCNGATAAVLDILESANFQSFRNLANIGRFVMLLDRKITLNPITSSSDTGGTTETGVHHYDFNFSKKLNLPIEYNSTAGAITEIKSNNIGVLLITAGGDMDLTTKFRVRFSDQ